MLDGIQIRRALERDVPGMSALLKSLFSVEADFSFDAFKQERGLKALIAADASKACALVAVDADGAIVGMVTMQLVISTAEGAPSGWIEDMVVDASFRRRSIGRRLLEEVIAWGAGQGATRFQLLADKANSPALEYYKQLGWNGTSLICLRLFQTQNGAPQH